MYRILPILFLLAFGDCKEPVQKTELEGFVVKNVIHPNNNPYNKDKVELGKLLYFDKRLSLKEDTNCAICHSAEIQNSEKSSLPRNKIHNSPAPSLTNVGLYKDVFADPQANDLEEIVKERVHTAVMLRDEKTIVARLNQVREYRELFEKSFGSPGITMDRIVKAISAFERTILSKNSKFDRYVLGEESALSPAQKRGLDVFMNKAKCSQCHKGPNFSDSEKHTTGLSGIVQKVRTPSLRDVSRKNEFMHNGEFTRLEDVVNHFVNGGVKGSIEDPLLKPAMITEEERKDLIEFLKSLEGETRPLEMPKIPRA
ncbi:cytochrome-c peroxidase [Leptospira alstonii]|uniref:Methylamine utilization protein MauG n=1 Tax=Leptospira alstonii serovar Pingchang str. 80-412 TaxID=1218564 RepID=T0G3B0_9LEPT|nr:cytochrome c peroxidase [Leptospira alstonii]EQA80692.1 di-heme cytochrome C peroxidase [Leptospira alstonii serovar Pingchang str. 80-412]